MSGGGGEGVGSEEENNSLYEMVQAYMIENEKLRRDTAELTHSRDKVTHQLQDLAQENVRLVKKLEQFEAVFLVMQHNNSNSNNSSPGGSKSHPATQRSSLNAQQINGLGATLSRPAMAAQLNSDQQIIRRNAGLPPVMSNRGVPNGFTSPRANALNKDQGPRSPDRKSTQTNNPSQQSTGSRNSLQTNTNQTTNRHHQQQQQPRSHPVTVRGSNSTNQNGERNSDSGIFSDDENDARRLQNRNNRMNNAGGSNSIQSFNRNIRQPPTNASVHSTSQNISQKSSVFPQKTSTPKVNVVHKPGSSFSNSDTSELAQINEKLLKDIQSLDSEIEFYTQRVKKPRK
ncbi:uncharacterized protein LOC142335321 [Convolutriloba macropyga]|uniref:uncharacterized protein LOC142335321 n=1 Tax=Convolutriloba macropyga TaxID=536237 RepID=UPI003F525D52